MQIWNDQDGVDAQTTAIVDRMTTADHRLRPREVGDFVFIFSTGMLVGALCVAVLWMLSTMG